MINAMAKSKKARAVAQSSGLGTGAIVGFELVNGWLVEIVNWAQPDAPDALGSAIAFAIVLLLSGGFGYGADSYNFRSKQND